MEYLYFIKYIEKMVTGLAVSVGALEIGACNRDIHTMTAQAKGKQACCDIEQRSTSHFPLRPEQQSSWLEHVKYCSQLINIVLLSSSLSMFLFANLGRQRYHEYLIGTICLCMQKTTNYDLNPFTLKFKNFHHLIGLGQKDLKHFLVCGWFSFLNHNVIVDLVEMRKINKSFD